MEAELDALRVRRMSEVEKEAVAKKEELEAQLKEKMDKTMRELEQVGLPRLRSLDIGLHITHARALLTLAGLRHRNKSPVREAVATRWGRVPGVIDLW